MLIIFLKYNLSLIYYKHSFSIKHKKKVSTFTFSYLLNLVVQNACITEKCIHVSSCTLALK